MILTLLLRTAILGRSGRWRVGSAEEGTSRMLWLVLLASATAKDVAQECCFDARLCVRS
jgi:hypothetical protein